MPSIARLFAHAKRFFGNWALDKKSKRVYSDKHVRNSPIITEELMRRTHLNLTEKQWDKLQSLSSETGLNVSEHLRRAVDKYLDKVELKTEENEAVKQESQG